jgi:hypothetical protein
MPQAGFELTIPASERRQSQALDRAANGIGQPKYVMKLQVIFDIETF